MFFPFFISTFFGGSSIPSSLRYLGIRFPHVRVVYVDYVCVDLLVGGNDKQIIVGEKIELRTWFSHGKLGVIVTHVTHVTS